MVLVARLLRDPTLDVDAWGARLAGDGLVLSLGAIFSAIASLLALGLVVSRVEPRPWVFLGLTRVPISTWFGYAAVLVAFVLVSDTLTWLLGRTIVPPAMLDAYASSDRKAMLFLAIVLAAPVSEEIFVRGFLYGVLHARGVGVLWCALLTSLLWSSIHVQYDLYEISTLFVLGLLLFWARARSGSILPPFAMHALANAIAFVETAVVSARVT